MEAIYGIIILILSILVIVLYGMYKYNKNDAKYWYSNYANLRVKYFKLKENQCEI